MPRGEMRVCDCDETPKQNCQCGTDSASPNKHMPTHLNLKPLMLLCSPTRNTLLKFSGFRYKLPPGLKSQTKLSNTLAFQRTHSYSPRMFQRKLVEVAASSKMNQNLLWPLQMVPAIPGITSTTRLRRMGIPIQACGAENSFTKVGSGLFWPVFRGI